MLLPTYYVLPLLLLKVDDLFVLMINLLHDHVLVICLYIVNVIVLVLRVPVQRWRRRHTHVFSSALGCSHACRRSRGPIVEGKALCFYSKLLVEGLGLCRSLVISLVNLHRGEIIQRIKMALFAPPPPRYITFITRVWYVLVSLLALTCCRIRHVIVVRPMSPAPGPVEVQLVEP